MLQAQKSDFSYKNKIIYPLGPGSKSARTTVVISKWRMDFENILKYLKVFLLLRNQKCTDRRFNTAETKLNYVSIDFYNVTSGKDLIM